MTKEAQNPNDERRLCEEKREGGERGQRVRVLRCISSSREFVIRASSFLRHWVFRHSSLRSRHWVVRHSSLRSRHSSFPPERRRCLGIGRGGSAVVEALTQFKSDLRTRVTFLDRFDALGERGHS